MSGNLATWQINISAHHSSSASLSQRWSPTDVDAMPRPTRPCVHMPLVAACSPRPPDTVAHAGPRPTQAQKDPESFLAHVCCPCRWPLARTNRASAAVHPPRRGDGSSISAPAQRTMANGALTRGTAVSNCPNNAPGQVRAAMGRRQCAQNQGRLCPRPKKPKFAIVRAMPPGRSVLRWKGSVPPSTTE
jgi:hypothetical protein